VAIDPSEAGKLNNFSLVLAATAFCDRSWWNCDKYRTLVCQIENT